MQQLVKLRLANEQFWQLKVYMSNVAVVEVFPMYPCYDSVSYAFYHPHNLRVFGELKAKHMYDLRYGRNFSPLNEVLTTHYR